MFNKENSDDILKRHFGLKDLVSPTKRDKFEDSSDDEDDREIIFDPPPEISSDILTQTPVIRLTTPIRKKEKKKEELEIPEIRDEPSIPTINIPTRASPRMSPIPSPTSPVIDISDEDEINEKVMDLISNPGKPNYDKESKKIQDLCMEAFRMKFENLKMNYPERKIEFPEGKKIHRVHSSYHSIIKNIYVNMNLGQIQLSYILTLMALEFLAIKAFGIPMSGFTKMELKRMYRHNQLMIEIGESFYSTSRGSGGKPEPLEWRVFTSFGWSIVIFLGLKFLSKYIGGESMTDVIRTAVDKILDNPVTIDNIENGTAAATQESDGLEGIFEGMMGGDGKGFTELLTNIGTNFTEKMENKGGKKENKSKRRVIFEE
jgi:hypothetical protein